MALNQISKITLTYFDPKRFLGIEDKAVQTLLLGTLIGHATGTVKRKSPDGTQDFVGLAGSFEAVIASMDGTPKDGAASGVLFMPESFQNVIISELADQVNADGEVVKPGADAVNFAFEIYVKRAGNPQGYEWMLKPLVEAAPDQHDPLMEMRKALPSPFASKLLAAAPQPENSSEPAPTGGKKK